MDKNFVILEGRIASPIKKGKTKDGKLYCSFMLSCSPYSREYHDRTENREEAPFAVLVFDKRILEGLDEVGARMGNRASVFARLNGYSEEKNGKMLYHTMVIARDVRIIKTKQ